MNCQSIRKTTVSENAIANAYAKFSAFLILLERMFDT